jgi:hypothetical protein
MMDMSSSYAVMNRGSAASLPLYYTSKVARNTIAKTAYGMYNDNGIVAYGISPFVYLTDMIVNGCEAVGITPDQHSQMVSPFLEPGDPSDLGYLSVAAALHKFEGLESGISYGVFPIPAQCRDEDDSERTGSVLYSLSEVHGADLDGTGYDATRLALTKLRKVYYSNGTRVPDSTLRKIMEGIEEARQRCLLQNPKA